ncbi:MAG: hypothetical protein ACXQT5_07695 [Candidatus Syntropharchaeia archaeon]
MPYWATSHTRQTLGEIVDFGHGGNFELKKTDDRKNINTLCGI